MATAVAEFNDTSPALAREGLAGAMRMTELRALHVEIRDADGGERGAAVSDDNQLEVNDSPGTTQLLIIKAAVVDIETHIDNVVVLDHYAWAPTTDHAMMMGAFCDEVSTNSVHEGDGGALRMTNDRMLRTIDGALEGPGAPTVDSYGSAVIDVAIGQTDSEIIGTPGANKQLWIYGLSLVVDTEDTTLFLESAATALTGTYTFREGDGIQKPLCGNFGMPYYKCGTDEAFTITNTVGTVDGDVQYAIVSV